MRHTLPTPRRRARNLRRALTASAVGLLTVLGPMGTSPASAHAPTNCYHGNQFEGGWTAIYVYHYWDGPIHFNVYDHYLNGSYQHTYYLQCN